MGLPHHRVLFDFEPTSRRRDVLGGDPADLSDTPTEAVRSMITADSVLTIYANQGQGQDMADFLAIRTDLLQVVAAYAQHYREEQERDRPHLPGLSDFRLYPLTAQETANIQANTGRTLPPGYDDPR